MYTKSSAENYPRTSPPGADGAGRCGITLRSQQNARRILLRNPFGPLKLPSRRVAISGTKSRGILRIPWGANFAIAKFGIIAALSTLCIIFTAAFAGTADFERLEKGHFVIYHQNRDLANDLIWKAEYYYKKILGHFGVAEFRPWEGKDKCEIYLYKTKADFMKATGAPEWSVGLAQMSPFRFSAYENSEKLATTTFPHELTHMIFHLFMDKKKMPLWLEEGMAQFEEEDQTSEYRSKRFVKWNVKNGTYIRLSELINIEMVPEDNVDGFYTESASVADHLVTDNLRTSFGKFLTCLENGKSVDEALKNSYQWKYKNGVSDLETRWLEFIKRKY